MAKKGNYLETEDKTNDTKEKIHEVEIKIGKETGERVAKRATEGIAGRRRRMEEELKD